MKTQTDTIISALRVLARDIHTDDGVVNACLEEAAGRERNKTVANLIKQRDEAIASARQEPSRLEIAAMAMQAFIGSSAFIIDIPRNSLEYADALIAAAKGAR